jgi:hypothetical protein
MVLLLGAASGSGAASPESLRAAYQRMGARLAHSDLGRPVQIDSTETPDGLQGDIHAVLAHPLSRITATLRSPSDWCELLTLHVNNRRCRTHSAEGRDLLTLHVVRRYDKPVEQAFQLTFAYRLVEAAPGHLSVEMSAAEGPLGTRNYRVTLEAIAIDDQRSFLHFSYSYEQNMMVRLATQAYLSTFGRDKVGFTVVGKGADGQPEYIRGPRGLVERNAMRYFLALDAHLSAASDGEPLARERHWFAATQRHPRQLREIDLDIYLALKREDRQRERAGR